jgi:hypothetical protein
MIVVSAIVAVVIQILGEECGLKHVRGPKATFIHLANMEATAEAEHLATNVCLTGVCSPTFLLLRGARLAAERRRQ